MGPVIKGTISLSEEYSVQKLRSAFLFNPAGDKNEEVLESLHQETGLAKQVIRTTFSKLRKRMNLKRFHKISESETLTEEIGDDVKRSGISPIAYQDKLSPPRKTAESGKTTGSPGYNNDAEQLLREREAKSVNNSPSPVSAPVVQVKSEPRVDLPQQSRVKVEPRVKEESLTIEEKARQYDVLKADFAGLQAQMEELKKRIQGGGGEVKPPVVKTESDWARQNYHHAPHAPQPPHYPPGYPPWQPPPPYQMFYPPAPGPAPPPPYMLTSYPSYQENIRPQGYQAQYYPQPPVLLGAIQHIKQEPKLSYQANSQTKYPPLRPKP